MPRDAHSALPSVTAARVTSAIRLDGKLDESAWGDALPAREFTQTEPREGDPASERTEARFLYDDEALYVGVRCGIRRATCASDWAGATRLLMGRTGSTS